MIRIRKNNIKIGLFKLELTNVPNAQFLSRKMKAAATWIAELAGIAGAGSADSPCLIGRTNSQRSSPSAARQSLRPLSAGSATSSSS